MTLNLIRHKGVDNMPTVWDILTVSERREVQQLEEKICEAKTLRQQRYYEKCAKAIMEQAKNRYIHNKIATLEALVVKDEQAATNM